MALSGWESIGYGLGGGYAREKAKGDEEYSRRKALQDADIKYKTSLSASTDMNSKKTEQEIDKIKLENARLHREQSILMNSVAGDKMDTALNSMVTTGDYENFNRTLKDPILADRFKQSYGADSIRPIDWNNKQDVGEFMKATGTSIEDLSQMISADGYKEAISKNFYMTSNGKLLPSDKLYRDTKYLDRMTSTEKSTYVKTKMELDNAGKRFTTDQVKAQMLLKWSEQNPDGNINDFNTEYLKTQTDEGIRKDNALTENDMKAKSAEQDGKPITKSEQLQTYLELAKLKAEDKLPEKYNKQFEVYRDQFATEPTIVKSINENYQDRISKFDGDKLFSTEITAKDIADANTYQTLSKNTVSSKTKNDLKDELNIVIQGKSIYNDISKLSNEELNMGITDRAKQWLISKLSDKDFTKLSEEDKQKVLATVKFDTKLGQYLASYIKSISGSAVAEQEYARLSDLLGGDKFKNIETRAAAIKSFLAAKETSFRTSLKAGLRSAPGITLDLTRQLNNYDTPDTTKQENKVVRKVKNNSTGKMYNQYSDGTLEEIK